MGILNIYAVLQAIALSLQDTETSGAHVLNSVPSENDKRKENPSIQDRSRKKGRKPVSIIHSGDFNKNISSHYISSILIFLYMSSSVSR